ncbi:MAG: VOC family protein [Solirubrobacterales bacterium]
MNPKITPYLWYDADPREVIAHYSSIFDNFEVVSEMPGLDGRPIGATVRLDGVEYVLFQGGPGFPQTEAFSLMIHTDDQEQTDRYWDALIADGGQPSQCGWLKDKFGVSWQVTPRLLLDYLSSEDSAAQKRAVDAMMKMQKIDIAELQAAYEANG